jgi:hypothetical protein
MSLLGSSYQAKQCLGVEILRKGKEITLRKVTQGAYNPATGTTTNTNSDTTLKALIKNTMSDASQRIIENNDKIEGTVTPWNLSVVLQHTEEPTKEWKVIYNAVEYTIIHITYRILTDSYELVLKR